jgi:LmbE family N-acetylglucosaminyl deacetylase
LANEKCLRTGYLSLTRGDGGQNLIGSEQGIELGIIRTQELLAARRIDGGEQFFTRAYDFGFSKNPEETFTKWSHDSILSDMVWVIRNFRPDIIITRFATDGSGGHGHHTASAILAEEAFDAAADPTRFPEQLQYVSIWKTRRMFWNVSTRFANPNADMSPFIKLDVGGYNPLLGKSYGEIAAESRSMHKSQGFGSAKQRGEYFEYFKPIKGDTSGLKDIFEGIDFTWKRYKARRFPIKPLENLIKNYNVSNPELSINDAFKLIDTLPNYELDYQTETEKTIQLYEIIKNISGLWTEQTSDVFQISNKDTISLTSQIINRLNSKKIILNRVSSSALSFEKKIDSLLSKDKIFTYKEKYFFNKPFVEYNSGELIKKRNMFSFEYKKLYPFDENKLTYVDVAYQIFSFSINGFNYSQFTTPIYKWVDPEKGELYRPLVITPPVMLNLTQKSFVFTDEKPKEITITLKAGKDSITGYIKALYPKGWTVETKGSNLAKNFNGENNGESGITFSIHKKGEEIKQTFVVYPRTSFSIETIKFIAIVNGTEYTKGIKEIKYDHIPVQTWFPEAEAKLVKVDVKKTFNTVGYIQGAGDEVPASLEQMGYKVIIITDEQLQNGNLNEFPAIVLGVRAFNTNEKLQQYKQRVFDYVKDGGNLIVQYNTNSFAGPLKDQISPVPFKLSRDRVTIEEAPVTFLLPEHPVLNFPNKITNADFDGWIQERGIYFAAEMDSSFQCPLSMNDPGEKPNKGSLIIAKYGKGNYVYTGLAFFRELPAGVPGTYRLFANILSLEKRK